MRKWSNVKRQICLGLALIGTSLGCISAERTKVTVSKEDVQQCKDMLEFSMLAQIISQLEEQLESLKNSKDCSMSHEDRERSKIVVKRLIKLFQADLEQKQNALKPLVQAAQFMQK